MTFLIIYLFGVLINVVLLFREFKIVKIKDLPDIIMASLLSWLLIIGFCIIYISEKCEGIGNIIIYRRK